MSEYNKLMDVANVMQGGSPFHQSVSPVAPGQNMYTRRSLEVQSKTLSTGGTVFRCVYEESYSNAPNAQADYQKRSPQAKTPRHADCHRSPKAITSSTTPKQLTASRTRSSYSPNNDTIDHDEWATPKRVTLSPSTRSTGTSSHERRCTSCAEYKSTRR